MALSRGARLGLTALFFVAAAAAISVTFMFLRTSEDAQQLGSRFSLIDQNGEEVTHRDLRGQPSLMFFGFTHCPEICPTTIQEIDYWLEEIGPEADEVKAFFVTVDPERDTPEVLQPYLEYFGPRVRGITGDPEEVKALARSWKVYFKAQPPDETGNYNMDHTATVYMLRPDASYFGGISYGAEQEEAVAKIRRLLAES